MKSLLLVALSFIVGGVLLSGIARFNYHISQSSTLARLDAMAQSRLETIVHIVKNDINHIGTRVKSSDNEIVDFNINRIKFKRDIDLSINNLVPGLVLIEENNTTNQFIRKVWNISDPSNPVFVSSESTEMGGLDTLNIKYFDSSGNQVIPGVGNADDIRSLEITIVAMLDSPYEKGDDNLYFAKKLWKSEIHPKNLANN